MTSNKNLFLALTFITWAMLGQDQPTITRQFHQSHGDQLERKVVICGNVLEKNSNESLPQATVYIANTKLFTQTDSSGYFAIDITKIYNAKENYIVGCRLLGYKEKTYELKYKITQTIEFNFILQAQPLCDYGEVIISRKYKLKLHKKKR